jgi:S-adenosyl-L-homocysteine hydrolase-like protein
MSGARRFAQSKHGDLAPPRGTCAIDSFLGAKPKSGAGAARTAANAEKYGKTVTMLPKKLDEEVARLHLDQLGVKLTKLSKEQSDYLGVPVEGPYEADHYRY